MQTQRNEIGMKTRKSGSSHIAKIVAAAKESDRVTAQAIADYKRTCEVETKGHQRTRELEKLAHEASLCRIQVENYVAALTAEHDRALAYRNELNDTAYRYIMRRIPEEITPKIQAAEAELRAVNDKLMRAGLEEMATRWDLLAAGVSHCVASCDHRLELIEAALGSNKPKKVQKRRADGKFASNRS